LCVNIVKVVFIDFRLVPTQICDMLKLRQEAVADDIIYEHVVCIYYLVLPVRFAYTNTVKDIILQDIHVQNIYTPMYNIAPTAEPIYNKNERNSLEKIIIYERL